MSYSFHEFVPREGLPRWCEVCRSMDNNLWHNTSFHVYNEWPRILDGPLRCADCGKEKLHKDHDPGVDMTVDDAVQIMTELATALSGRPDWNEDFARAVITQLIKNNNIPSEIDHY